MENQKPINGKQRLPRPIGLTMLSLNHQKQQTNESKEALIEHLVTQYTLQGFTINGKNLNLFQLAHYTQIHPDDIMFYLQRIGQNLGSLVDPSNIQDTLQSIISLSTTWAIQDRGLIRLQTENLLKSQGDKFQPFISTEVNKALKLNLESNKNMMELFKPYFTPSATQQVLNIYGNVKQANKENLITTEDALIIIQSEQKALEANNSNQLMKEKLFEEHGIGETPNCLENPSSEKTLKPFGEVTYAHKELDSQEATKLKGLHSEPHKRRKLPTADTETLP